MAACNPTIFLHTFFWRVVEGNAAPEVFLDAVDFDLTVAANGHITGDAIVGNIKLSDVTGTCKPLTLPNGNLLTLTFNWNLVNIFLVGFTFAGTPVRFRGRFRAERAGVVPPEFDKRLIDVLTPPGDGETGTTTGTQT